MKISRRQLRQIILENLEEEIIEGSSGSGGLISRTYTDNAGYKFKVYGDGRIFLTGRDDKERDEPKELIGSQKTKVAKNLVRDIKSQGKRVGDDSVLARIARGEFDASDKESPATADSNSTEDTDNEWALGEAKVWLINYPDAKPATARAMDALEDSVGSEAAKSIKSVVDTILPQGHGGVYLRKSDGSGVYYDFGCYYGRCGRGSKIELNFADQLVHDYDPTGKAFGMPGEVRRRQIPKNASKKSVESILSGFNSGGTTVLYYTGETTDEDIDAGIARAEALYKKGCVQYSLMPRTSFGLAYNCGTFAITIAAIAKTGSDAGGFVDRAVQYSQNAQPGLAIEPAAKKLAYV